MDEQSSEAGRLGFAHKPSPQQLGCDLIIDGGGLKRRPDRLAAESDKLLERLPFRMFRRGEVALAGNLGVAERRRRAEERVHLIAVAANEPVHRASGGSRLAQLLELRRLLTLAGPSQLPLGLVAPPRELLQRQLVQPVDDLLDPHPR
jgi:hypothetical protein